MRAHSAGANFSRANGGSALHRVALWLAACCAAVSALAASETVHTVQRGETHRIARRHGVSISALAERNGVDKNYHVYAGERLVIPTKWFSKDGSAATLSPAVQRAIDKAAVKLGRWKHIVVHHSGVDAGTIEGMDRYHREERHMKNGLAYHFVIGNGKGIGDGRIAACERWTKQLDGGHVASESLNENSLGICLVGNFDKHKPNSEQMRQLTALVRALLSRCKLSASAVKTHQQIHRRHTRCPGKYFPAQIWLKSLMDSANIGRTMQESRGPSSSHNHYPLGHND